jgi:predicted TIM-barrel fold metal-dependent hydrolase
MRIDVHAHWWAASYLDLLVELGRKDLARAGRQSDDLGPRIDEMDSVGVERQYCSAIGLNTVLPSAAASVRAARHLNDRYVEIRERYAGRFDGYATLTLPFVDEAIEEARRALDELRLVGVAMPCLIDGKPLDSPEFEPLWEYLGERGAVVYVHPVGSDSASVPGLADYGLNMALGSPLQVATTALRLGLSGLTTRHPKLQFILAVSGGVLPYLWHRYERNLRRGLEMTAVAAVGGGFFDWMKEVPFDHEDPMSLFRRSFWFDSSVQDIPAALEWTKRTVGTDRMVLGSDAIFASLTEAVQMVEDSDALDADEKTAVLDTNAEALFRSVRALS